jgi:PadR family transcriptional regulator PadR
MNLKGTLPILVLSVLENGPCHGYSIAQQIKQRSEGVLDFKEGTLYPALHSQEKKGLIKSESKIEKGRKRRYYKLTPKGTRALAKERQEWKLQSEAVTDILGGLTHAIV